MKKIFYLGYYDTLENKSENRNIVLAAANKMKYIISALDEFGDKVQVVSVSATKNRESYPQKYVMIGENSELLLFKTLPYGNGLRRFISRNYVKYNVLKYLLTTVCKNDRLIVYHSVAYADIIRLAKRIKKFKLILEVEEIYSDVNDKDKDRKKEFKLFGKADAYIFPTELLNLKLNPENKPYIMIHGTYQVESDRRCGFKENNVKENDTRIVHCVYAGTFDPRKGGAISAAAAAEYLPANYHIHILGFGSETDTQNMKDTVEKLAETCKCKITYDGLLSGEDYIRFIQSCDIGLSTQNPDAAFNDTSFPSKILSYMANGLRVVSIRIPAVETSAIGEYMYYYDKQTPEEIAKAIMAVNIEDDYDGRKVIANLDKEFQHDLAKLLEE